MFYVFYLCSFIETYHIYNFLCHNITNDSQKNFLMITIWRYSDILTAYIKIVSIADLKLFLCSLGAIVLNLRLKAIAPRLVRGIIAIRIVRFYYE